MTDDQFNELPERSPSPISSEDVQEGSTNDIEAIVVDIDDVDRYEELDIDDVKPQAQKAVETPAHRRERARTWLGAGVVGGWVFGALGSGVSIIADWVTWEEIDDLASTFTTVTIAVVAFYFGTQSKDE